MGVRRSPEQKYYTVNAYHCQTVHTCMDSVLDSFKCVPSSMFSFIPVHFIYLNVYYISILGYLPKHSETHLCMQVACSLKGRHPNYDAFYEALF